MRRSRPAATLSAPPVPTVGFERGEIVSLELKLEITAAGHADEHAGPAPHQRVDRLRRMLERFPRHLERQPLLWIEA